MSRLIPGWVWFYVWPVFLFISRCYFLMIHNLFTFINLFRTRQYVTEPTDRLQLISATQAVRMITQREITSSQLVDSYIRRIEQINSTINALVVKLFDEARAAALECDKTIESCTEEELQDLLKKKPLFGVPFTMKDAIQVKDVVVTCGIYNRKNTKCTETAIVVTRMREAGAILLGLTNVPEVCMWVESINTIYGRTCNPYDSRRMCGGSSGGEAALISGAGSVIGLGSDIGGSIRMPCFFNGIFGIKPTPGVIPLNGHVPEPKGYRMEMLRIGPMCRYAEDLPLLLKILAGSNADQLRLDEPVARKKLRLFYSEGIKENPVLAPISYEMRTTLRKAVKFFERKYDLVAHQIELPTAAYAMDMFMLSMEDKTSPDFRELMIDIDGGKGQVNCFTELVPFVLGKSKHTLPALITGIVNSVDVWTPARRKEITYMRERLKRQIRELLGDDGILLFPSWPSTALFHIEPLLQPLNFAYTSLWNSLALPAAQCPMGLDSNGLPLGVQVVGAPFSDRLLIAVAQDLEEGFNGWTPARGL